MSSNPISDKELETLLRRAAAALEIENIGHFSGEVSDELTLLVEDCDTAASLLYKRRTGEKYVGN